MATKIHALKSTVMRSCTKNSRAQHYCINTKPEEIITFYQKALKTEQPSFEDGLKGALKPREQRLTNPLNPFLGSCLKHLAKEQGFWEFWVGKMIFKITWPWLFRMLKVVICTLNWAQKQINNQSSQHCFSVLCATCCTWQLNSERIAISKLSSKGAFYRAHCGDPTFWSAPWLTVAQSKCCNSTTSPHHTLS